jgi:hypothetical protein
MHIDSKKPGQEHWSDEGPVITTTVRLADPGGVGAKINNMAQPYLERMKVLVGDAFPDPENLECKHFFGGAALYVGDKICASLTPSGLAFKLPSRRCADLISSGDAVQLRYFAKAPIKKGYVLFANPAVLSKRATNALLVECSVHVSRGDA